MAESKISTDEITCPYCDYKHRDLVDYKLFDAPEEFECDNCGKTFIISEIDYSVTYYTDPEESDEKDNDNG